MLRELEANGTSPLSFHLDDFIMKITVPRFIEVTENRAETEQKTTVKWTENQSKLIQKWTEKATSQGIKLTEKRIAMLMLMMDNPYISKSEIAIELSIHPSAVSRNIETLRGKLLRHVGSDKGGFWEIIIEDHACRTETEQKPNRNRTETEQKVAEKTTKLKLLDKQQLINTLTEQASSHGVKLTENRIAMIIMMIDDPYISRAAIAKRLGINTSAVSRNIDALRGKIIRRVGPDKGGFWEIIV